MKKSETLDLYARMGKTGWDDATSGLHFETLITREDLASSRLARTHRQAIATTPI